MSIVKFYSKSSALFLLHNQINNFKPSSTHPPNPPQLFIQTLCLGGSFLPSSTKLKCGGWRILKPSSFVRGGKIISLFFYPPSILHSSSKSSTTFYTNPLFMGVSFFILHIFYYGG